MKRAVLILGILCLTLLSPSLLLAQQAQPPTYIFVAEWAVPRDQWDAFAQNWDKNIKPVLERHAGNGTLVHWGAFSSVVHEEGAMTHGIWFASGSVAGIERVREELIKLPPTPFQATAKHRDYFLRSILHAGRTTAPASGYLMVSSQIVQPGKGADWRAHFEKYSKPVYDELVKNGTISMYTVDGEYIHTTASGLRFTVYVTPTADGVDKVNAAFQAANEKRSAEERRAIGQAFADLVVAGEHRDGFSRAMSYWIK